MTGGLGCSTYTNWMSCDLKTKNARTVNKKFNLTKPKLVAYDVCLGATLPTYIYAPNARACMADQPRGG